jgi:hypothetical protein
MRYFVLIALAACSVRAPQPTLIVGYVCTGSVDARASRVELAATGPNPGPGCVSRSRARQALVLFDDGLPFAAIRTQLGLASNAQARALVTIGLTEVSHRYNSTP